MSETAFGDRETVCFRGEVFLGADSTDGTGRHQ